MSDTVRIQVTAKDDASDDFQRIGKAAQTMGQQVQNAGKASASGLTPVGPAAKNAQKALADVETQAKKTATSSDDIKKKWTEVGAAAGVLVTGLSLVGRAYVQQERQIDGLERAYGDAADQLIEFSEEMQRTTVYSNDAARAATLSAASLAQNYGLTADQIEEVVRISADLATVTGVDLQDATMRVAGAIRGEGEAAELLGLNMSDAALAALAATAGLEGWNTTMTEGEKAAFRYTVAMDQAAFATGAAADAAETNAGNARQFVNVLQDQAQALGDALGPAAEYASVLGSFALAAPVATAGIGRLAVGIKTAASATGLLAIATNPVTLAIGAVAIAAGGAYLAYQHMQDAQDALNLSSKEVAATTTDLVAILNQLGQAGTSDQGLLAVQQGVLNMQELGRASIEAADDIKVIDDQIAKLNATLSDPYGAAVSTEQASAIKERIALLEIQRTALETAHVSETSYAEGIKRTSEILSDTTRINYPQLLEAVNAAWEAFQRTGDGDAYIDTLQFIQENVDSLGLSLSDVVPQVHAVTRAYLRMATARSEGFLDPNDEGMGLPDATAQAERNAEAAERAATGQVKLAEGMAASTAAAVESANALNEAQSAVVDYIASGENLLTLLYESGQALSGEQGFIGGVIDLQNSLSALGSAYSIIIDGSEALGASTQQLSDHYSELVGVALDEFGSIVYTYAEIDNLLAKGVITQDQYNAAVDATTSILLDNAEVQQNIASIQAQQAPYLAALASDTENYVEALSRQDAQQQRNVLTLMDANSQQQLAALYAAATDAAMGDLGSQGTQYVNDMAAALQITNPLLYDMLVSSGAIKETADGIEFNFDEVDASALVTTLDNLNTTLGDLIDLIADINGMTIAPKVDPMTLEAIQSIGTYTAGNNKYGDATGGPMGAAGGSGGYVQGPSIEKTETITITANAEPYFRVSSDVQANAELLAGTEQQLLITADNTQAIGVFRDTEGSIVAITANDHIIKVTGDPTDATNDITLVNRALNDLNGTEGVIYVKGDPSGATTAVNDAEAARNSVDGTSATISVLGDNSSARAAINAVTGYQGTAYVTVVANRVGNFGPISPYRDGGIVGYDAAALDGIVTHGGYRSIMVGESGKEILRVPPGSSVTPAPMTNALTGNSHGGKEVHLHFHNAVYGMDDFQQQVSQAVRSAVYQGQYA